MSGSQVRKHVVACVTSLGLALAAPSAHPAAFDFNNDGRSDILWRNTATGENYIYPMNGTTILAGEGYLRAVADQSWKIVGIGSFDGTGGADILWRNSSTGENYIYLMTGTAIVGEGFIRSVADQAWQVAGVGDFDGDGKSDILWRNSSTGQNYVHPMNGLAIKAGEGYLRTVADLSWRIAGVGDFNADGRADILWRNSSTGENYLYPMNGLAILPAEGYLRTVANQAWKIVGTGDFDGDGKADILWRNSSTGENYLYPMNGTAILATEGYLRTVADQNWKVQATGDYDGNGNADVLWRNTATGENYLYFMNGTTIAGEGYLRKVADQQWQVAGSAYAAPALSCQQQLQQLNVTFAAAAATPGIDDPVTVSSPVNGIVFRRSGGQVVNMLMDCSLALALHRVAGDLVMRGIDTVDHFGTYNYRCIGAGTPPDCPSGLNAHAYGTAIDFAAFWSGQTSYSVLNDWVIDPDAENTCTAATANAKDELLHRVACWWHDAGIFNIILTPNYNADHRNHFHVEVTPGADYIQ